MMIEKIENAMVFAAGLGTRLMPLTTSIPKALAPLNGEPLIFHVLKKLENYGIKNVVVNTHHFADVFELWLKKINFNFELHISHENALLDTAGGLKFAADFFPSKDILLYNVDVISTIDLDKFAHAHFRSGAIATIAVRNRKSSRYFLFNKQNQLIGWRNTTTNQQILCRKNQGTTNELAFSGIHIVKHELLDLIPANEKLSLTPFYLDLAASKPIKSYVHNSDAWFDCGKLETLQEAELYLHKTKK